MSTHAALVVPAPGQMVIGEVPTKRPRSGEMLVAPLYVGICGSDLDMLRGVRPIGTHILGHEGVAEVVAVGPDTADFSVGQRVTFLPNNPNDPEEALGVSTEGLNQQYLLISQADLERGMVVPFDTEIPLACGPLLEPFATAIYGQHLVDQVCKPETMVIVGAGPIGLLNALYARGQRCAQILLVDTSQARLDWAVRRGVVEDSHAILSSPHLADSLLERTAGQGIAAAFLCTPRSATRSVLQQALRYVRAEGCVSLTAGTNRHDELPELPGVDLNGIRQANVCGIGREARLCVTQEGKRLWLTGHSGASASFLQEAMQLVVKEPAVYARVISHRVSYRAAPRIFEHLLAGETHDVAGVPRVKVVIDFTREDQEIEAFEPHQFVQDGLPDGAESAAGS